MCKLGAQFVVVSRVLFVLFVTEDVSGMLIKHITKSIDVYAEEHALLFSLDRLSPDLLAIDDFVVAEHLTNLEVDFELVALREGLH